METLKLIEISACVGFGVVFGSLSARVFADIICKLGKSTGEFLARVLK